MTRPTDFNHGSPANLDAEEGLLACCILETGQEIITQCIEAKITPDYFFKPAHQLIFEAILALYSTQSGIDEIILAEKLNSIGRLDAVGGHAEINRMTNRVETTAHARYWLEIVREKALLRKLISTATGIVERCYSGGLTDGIARAEEAIADIAAQACRGNGEAGRNPAKERRATALLTAAKPFAFDVLHRPERRPPIISLAGFPVCKKGDLMAFMAPNKSGKSSAIAAMLAATFAASGSDCLGFEAANPDGEGVLHLMTEESVEDHDDMIRRSLRRARIEAPPPWFQSFHLRRFDTAKRRQFIFAKANEMAKERPIRLIVLDGFSDFVEDVNDNKECKAFADELLANIDALNCSIAGTIHVNPSLKHTERDKAMGHLGSIIERKASSILLLKKDMKEGIGEIITINTKDARKGKGDAPPRFVWCEDRQMHIRYVGPTDIVADAKSAGRSKQWTWERLATYFSTPFKPVSEWTFADRSALAQRAGTSEPTVRRLAVIQLQNEALSQLSEPCQNQL